MKNLSYITEEQFKKINEVNEIIKELIPFDDKLKEYGLQISIIETEPNNKFKAVNRFKLKMEQMIKDHA